MLGIISPLNKIKIKWAKGKESPSKREKASGKQIPESRRLSLYSYRYEGASPHQSFWGKRRDSSRDIQLENLS